MRVQSSSWQTAVFMALFLFGLALMAGSVMGAPQGDPPVAILPLGDSITEAENPYNSYRRSLWQQLQGAGYSVDFVGTRSGNRDGTPPNPDFDLDHEGRWGWNTQEVLNNGRGLAGRLNDYTPDIVLLHLGSNDLTDCRGVDGALDGLREIIAVLRNDNPSVTILLAQILPQDRERCGVEANTLIQQFNAALPALVAEQTTAVSPIILVDHHSGFDLATYSYDDIHPNEAGEQLMADRWLAALEPLLADEPTATPTPVPTPSGDPQRILFVRGGSGTGGFFEGGSDEHLSDINNSSTDPGNHGFGTLAQTLRDDGFVVEQLIEGPANNNTPIDLAGLNLSQYDVIVLGSNNAQYGAAAVDAVENWVRAGGGLLLISDANWGQNWGDAPSSDQHFLDRFGLIMNQDRGTYALEESAGEFVGLGQLHPVLAGVEAFDGEGVSPVTLGDTASASVSAMILARAENELRLNDNPDGGTVRGVMPNDAALLVAEAGNGRLVVHFDRNTFFNQNGAGTDITRLDNEQYARNLFRWLAGQTNAPQLDEQIFLPLVRWSSS